MRKRIKELLQQELKGMRATPSFCKNNRIGHHKSKHPRLRFKHGKLSDNVRYQHRHWLKDHKNKIGQS